MKTTTVLSQFSITQDELNSALTKLGYKGLTNSEDIPNDIIDELEEHFTAPKGKALKASQPKQSSTIQETSSNEFVPNSPEETIINDALTKTLFDVRYQEGYTQELLLQSVRNQGVLDAQKEARKQMLLAELTRSKQNTEQLSNALINLIDKSEELQEATLEVMGKEFLSYQETMKQLTPTLNY